MSKYAQLKDVYGIIPTDEISDTSFHDDTITCTVAQMRQAFGEPMFFGEIGDKVNMEWSFVMEDGVVFTIYDWKEYRGLVENSTYEWHIGAHNSASSAIAKNLCDKILLDLH